MNLNGFAEGRWLSPDPAGGDVTNPQSLNRYAYALNNPSTFVDPLGLETINYGSTAPPPCETQSGPLSPMTSCYTQFGIQAGTLPSPNMPDEFDMVFPATYVPGRNGEPSQLLFGFDPNGQAVLDMLQNQASSASWWVGFDSAYGKALGKLGQFFRGRPPGESFAGCVDQNINQTTLGVAANSTKVLATGLAGAVLTGVGSTSTGFSLAEDLLVRAASLVPRINLPSALTVAEFGGQAVAIGGGAALGLFVGSVANCASEGVLP
jgi:hypothetical protein